MDMYSDTATLKEISRKSENKIDRDARVSLGLYLYLYLYLSLSKYLQVSAMLNYKQRKQWTERDP